MSEAKKISELESGTITENSIFLNTIVDDVNGNSSTQVDLAGMRSAMSSFKVIEASVTGTGGVTLPTGVTGYTLCKAIEAGEMPVIKIKGAGTSPSGNLPNCNGYILYPIQLVVNAPTTTYGYTLKFEKMFFQNANSNTDIFALDIVFEGTKASVDTTKTYSRDYYRPM